MKRMLRVAPLLLILALGACLENEEEIVIHEDGSVSVRVAARGDRGDLANGYPVPLDVAWNTAGEDTATWLQLIGPDTGSAAVQQRVGEVAWPGEDEGDEEEAEVKLAVEGRFDTVSDLPEWYAPATEPYRTAYLRRTTRLDVRAVNGRTVYVFERVFQDRRQGPRDALTTAGDRLPEELQEKFSNHEPITAAEWETIAEVVRISFEDAAEQFARDALLGIYTKGDASLAPRAVPAILREVRAAAGASVSLDLIVAIYESNLTQGEKQNVVQDGEDEEGRLLRGMEEDLHRSIRDSLTAALRREGVAETTRNAILFGLEWGFTAYAHSDDILDEEFKVRLTLPGTIVSGNYEEQEDDTVSWSFEGKELVDHDVVLRAVSVLE